VTVNAGRSAQQPTAAGDAPLATFPRVQSIGRPAGTGGGAAICSSNPRTQVFRERFFPDVTDEQWDDWRWQVRHRIRTLDQFRNVLNLSAVEHNALVHGGTMLPVGVTPYYMSLMTPTILSSRCGKTVVPTTAEFTRMPGEAGRSAGEDGHSPVPGLVHRYPDRALLLPLDFCSTYCRYCTRSRVVGHGEIVPNEARLTRFSTTWSTHAGA